MKRSTEMKEKVKKAKRAAEEAEGGGDGEGANWGGAIAAAAAGSKKRAKKGPAVVDELKAETGSEDARPAVQPEAGKKSKKKKLGRKEREKLKLKAAKAQAQADEEAGRIAAGGAPQVTATATEGAAQMTDKKKRYTVFVGNLPYDATQQDVFKHFDNFLREMVLDVRMQHDKGTGEFRGTVTANRNTMLCAVP